MIIKQGTEDGSIFVGKSTWPPTGGTATVKTGTYATITGATKTNQYYLNRGYFRFNTSSIPANAVITGVKLWFKLYNKTNVDSFNIQIQVYRDNGDWGPTLGTGDWGCGDTLVGTKNWVDLPAIGEWFSIDLNPSCINKGGITAFETRGDHESGTAPTGYNDTDVYTADSSGNEPYLEISYFIPGAILLMQL